MYTNTDDGLETYWVSSIAHYACQALLPKRVGLMKPKPPWPYLGPNGQVLEHLAVQVRIRGQKLLYGGFLVPAVVGQVTSLSWEEAVVGKKAATIARRQHNFVVSIVSAPVFKSAVLGIVNESQLNSLCSFDVSMEASTGGRLTRCLDAKNTAKR